VSIWCNCSRNLQLNSNTFKRFTCKSTGGNTMKNALGVSLGITALVWTYLALNVIPGVLVWAGFIAWGAYFTVGKDALTKTISATIFGAVMAAIAVGIVALLDDYLAVGIAAPIAVGLTVYGLTAFDKLNNVPANVFGYAATFGFLLMGTGFNDALGMEGANLIALELANPIIVTSLSFVLGSVFGLISEKVAGMLK